MELIDKLGEFANVNHTYPVAFIVMFLAAFGAALNGLAHRARFKNQHIIIASLDKEIEMLLH